MFNKLFTGLLGVALVFTVSCSKKVKEDPSAGSDAAGISQESMNFKNSNL